MDRAEIERNKAEKSAFLREFGHRVAEAIYAKFGNKNEFLRHTGMNKVTLHQVITGGDTRLGTAFRIAKALDLEVAGMIPETSPSKSKSASAKSRSKASAS